MKTLNTILLTISMLFTIMLMMTTSVTASDVWDRVTYTVNYTPQFLNVTYALNNLQSQINNETQQRIVNDTYLQSQINVTKINITQLFNLTTIYGINITDLYNITTQINSDINSLQSSINQLYNITDNIYNNISSIDITIVALNDSINSINQTLTINVESLNATIIILNDSIISLNDTVTILNESLYNETQQRISNDSYLLSLFNNITSNLTDNDSMYATKLELDAVNQTIKQPAKEYLSFNSSYFYINESALNFTINNISKNRQNLYTSTINVTSGYGFIQTSNIEYLLTRIQISGSSQFKSECVESSTNNMIDKNRVSHSSSWDIEKNYAINDKINCTITNANTDSIFNITITYITNGIQ